MSRRFKIYQLFTLVVFLLMLCPGRAQTFDENWITGTVKSTSGKPLENVSIIEKNTYKGTVTDVRGNFEIKLDSSKSILYFSAMGYTPQEHEVTVTNGNQNNLEIYLKEQAYQIDLVNLRGKSAVRKINEQSYAVTSVATEDLYNSTSDAKQILNRVPGVRILQEGGLGSDLDFSLNGFSGDQVKFFLNGIPMDNFGSSFNLASIPVNSIERIDTYKGVVPVWLGTDALGGAVNIITNQKSNFLDVSYALGFFNTHRASINASASYNNGFTVRGLLNYNYSDNDYDVQADITDALGNIVQRDVEVRRFHDRYRSLTANLEAGWVATPFADQLLLGIIASGDDNQRQNGSTMAIPYGGVVTESRSLISTLKYKKQDLFLEGLDVSLNSALNFTNTKNIDTLTGVRYNWYGEALETGSSTNGELGEASLVELDDREITTQFNLAYLINDHHSVSLNYSYRNFHRETQDDLNPERVQDQFPNTLEKNILGFAYKYDYNQKWNATLFGKAYFLDVETSREVDFGNENRRIDRFKTTQDQYGYGIASSYFITPQLQVKASYEHAYRLPVAVELLGNAFDITPNANLEPEESDNLNVGFNYDTFINKNSKLAANANFVYRNADNLIYTLVNGPTRSYTNLRKARTLGVEGSLRYDWKDFFYASANMTYQDITDQADEIYDSYSGYQPNFNKGERIPNTPYLFGNAMAGVTFKDVGLKESQLRLNYTYNYVESFFFGWERFGNRSDKATIPTQQSHDIELGYSFNNNKYNIALECQNVTDNLLYDKFRLQKPGRAFFIKLRYTIN